MTPHDVPRPTGPPRPARWDAAPTYDDPAEQLLPQAAGLASAVTAGPSEPQAAAF